MTTSTFRQSYREVLAQAAEQARALLPASTNGRIESAVKLVLQADVVFNSDGTATVGSSSDPMKTYTLVGNACDCQDFAYGQAPKGFCQHRIAANLQRSVERVLARRAEPEPEPEVEMPADVEPYPDQDAEDVPPAHSTPGVSEPVPLPEAPASVNVHLMIDGRACQLTLRDTDETRLLARLTTVLAQYPMPAQAPAPSAGTQRRRHPAAAVPDARGTQGEHQGQRLVLPAQVGRRHLVPEQGQVDHPRGGGVLPTTTRSNAHAHLHGMFPEHRHGLYGVWHRHGPPQYAALECPDCAGVSRLTTPGGSRALPSPQGGDDVVERRRMPLGHPGRLRQLSAPARALCPTWAPWRRRWG